MGWIKLSAREVSVEEGWVADFCPFCRCFRPLKIERIERRVHVYWIFRMGRADHLHREVTCTECGITWGIDDGRYASVRHRQASLESLVRHTHPELPLKYARRIDLERRLLAGEVSEEERSELMEEAFSSSEQLMASVEAELDDQLGQLGGALWFLALPIAVVVFGGPWWASLALLGVVVFVLWLGRQRVLRRMRAELLPVVAMLFASLEPDYQELVEAFESDQQRDALLCWYLQVDELASALSRITPPSAVDAETLSLVSDIPEPLLPILDAAVDEAEQRCEQLSEALACHARSVDAGLRQFFSDWYVGLALCVMLVLPFLLAHLFSLFAVSRHERFHYELAGVALGAMLGMGVLWKARSRARARVPAALMPQLVTDLAQLDPEREEIEGLLERLKRVERFVLRQHLDIDALLRDIGSGRSRLPRQSMSAMHRLVRSRQHTLASSSR